MAIFPTYEEYLENYFPSNENSERLMDITNMLKSNNFDSIRLSVLKTIAQFNKEVLGKDDRNERILFGIVTNNDVYFPEYIEISEDGQTLVLSLSPNAFRRNTPLVMIIKTEAVNGIISQYLTSNEFETYSEVMSTSNKRILRNKSEEELLKLQTQLHTNIMNVIGSEDKIKKFMKKFNSILTYNYLDLLRLKRRILHQFFAYLEDSVEEFPKDQTFQSLKEKYLTPNTELIDALNKEFGGRVGNNFKK